MRTMINQCDGCRRGLPLIDGIHKGKGWDMIGCTANLYKRRAKTMRWTIVEFIAGLLAALLFGWGLWARGIEIRTILGG